MSDQFSLEFPSEPEWFGTARLFAAAVARHYGYQEALIEDLKVAVSEACNNAAHSRSDQAPLSAIATHEEDRLSFEIPRGGHAAMMAGEGSSEEPSTSELQRMLGAELIGTLFSDAEVSPAVEGGFDLKISLSPQNSVQDSE